MIEDLVPQLEVQDLAPDLWMWRIRHPGWTEDEDWQPVVTSICADLGDQRLVLDPLTPPPDATTVWDRLDARPPTAVMVLIPDHVRPSWPLRAMPGTWTTSEARWPRLWRKGASEADWAVDVLARRYGCAVYGPAALEPGAQPETSMRAVVPGTEWPGGAVVLDDPRGFNETPLWLPEQRVIVFADALTERKGVLRTWTMGDLEGRAAAALRRLLDLPFERVIISHGEPVHTRAAYERALELPPWPAGPLHLYAWKGELEVVRRLVEQGADLAAQDEYEGEGAGALPGHTALDWARGAGQQAVVDYLESIGAPGSVPPVDRESRG
jgi:hypothetical protein